MDKTVAIAVRENEGSSDWGDDAGLEQAQPLEYI